MNLAKMNLVYKTIRGIFSTPCDHTPRAEENTICVCQAIAPVFRFCQIFGICPVTLHNPTEDDENENHKSRLFYNNHIFSERNSVEGIRGKCDVSSRLFSFPSMINILLLIIFAPVTTWVIFNIQNFLKVYFAGTDFYTFGAQVLFLYTHTVILLLNGLFQKKKFGKIWSLLLKVLTDLTQNITSKSVVLVSTPSGPPAITITNAILQNISPNHVPLTLTSPLRQRIGNKFNLQQDNHKSPPNSKLQHRLHLLRFFAYVFVAVVLILSISHSVSFVYLVFHACFDKAKQSDPGIGKEIGKLPCPLSDVFLLLQKLCYGVIDFVQQGLVILFGVLCLIIYVFFREVEEQLEAEIKTGYDLKSIGDQGCYRIERLRISYEDLSQCCRLMSECFGLSVLAVLITSVISITCALYSITLSSGAIDKEETINVARFYVIWAFHGWFGCCSLFFILIPGQMISNASEAPSHVIGRCPLTHLSEETKYQLSQFQHQSRRRVVLTACNVTNIGLAFIAAAATNVTTYILVILQFRLGVEK